MEDPMPQPTLPNAPPELPEAWDYVLPEGWDPVPVPVRAVGLEEAETHFRAWIDAFPASWPSEAERWSAKSDVPFVMH